MWFNTYVSTSSRSYADNPGSTTDERYAVNMVDETGVSWNTYAIYYGHMHECWAFWTKLFRRASFFGIFEAVFFFL